MEILENIKEIRLKLGYSQEYVAAKLNTTQGSYAMIERGERHLRYSTLIELSNIFNMDIINVIIYPNTYELIDKNKPAQKFKTSITIELPENKKDTVLKFLLGETYKEIYKL